MNIGDVFNPYEVFSKECYKEPPEQQAANQIQREYKDFIFDVDKFERSIFNLINDCPYSYAFSIKPINVWLDVFYQAKDERSILKALNWDLYEIVLESQFFGWLAEYKLLKYLELNESGKHEAVKKFFMEKMKDNISPLNNEQGCYVLMNDDNEVIYVGQSKVLGKRMLVSARNHSSDKYFYVLLEKDDDLSLFEDALIWNLKPKNNVKINYEIKHAEIKKALGILNDRFISEIFECFDEIPKELL